MKKQFPSTQNNLIRQLNIGSYVYIVTSLQSTKFSETGVYFMGHLEAQPAPSYASTVEPADSTFKPSITTF